MCLHCLSPPGNNHRPPQQGITLGGGGGGGGGGDGASQRAIVGDLRGCKVGRPKSTRKGYPHTFRLDLAVENSAGETKCGTILCHGLLRRFGTALSVFALAFCCRDEVRHCLCTDLIRPFPGRLFFPGLLLSFHTAFHQPFGCRYILAAETTMAADGWIATLMNCSKYDSKSLLFSEQVSACHGTSTALSLTLSLPFTYLPLINHCSTAFAPTRPAETQPTPTTGESLHLPLPLPLPLSLPLSLPSAACPPRWTAGRYLFACLFFTPFPAFRCLSTALVARLLSLACRALTVDGRAVAQLTAAEEAVSRASAGLEEWEEQAVAAEKKSSLISR